MNIKKWIIKSFSNSFAPTLVSPRFDSWRPHWNDKSSKAHFKKEESRFHLMAWQTQFFVTGVLGERFSHEQFDTIPPQERI